MAWRDSRLEELVARVHPGARLLEITALKPDAAVHSSTKKGIGSGSPLKLDIELDGELRSLVLHGATPNAFGHDRRADRAAELIASADTWADLPNHVQVLDVGAYTNGGGLVSLQDSGEFYLLTEYAEGRPYADDLRRIALRGTLSPSDELRLEILVSYLARLHQTPLSLEYAYARAIRDLVGSGEGVFGILDSYPAGTPGASPERLQRIEAECVAWRWRLKKRPQRLVRIHGDFHPFNVLFDDDSQLWLLDSSRGSAGDAADDVACMAINFVFFGLEAAASWRSALSGMWFEFWRRYLELSGDAELLDGVAPFLAWRGLVLASPVWYPELAAGARARLLDFVEATLGRERFDPATAEEVFA